MEYLAHLLQLTESELKDTVYATLSNLGMNPVYENGFVYSKGNIPIMLVAHLDTVFLYPPKNLYYDRNKDIIFSSEDGLGGDDRCGVYAIMRILQETNLRPHVLFTEEEEIGGLGALLAINKLTKPDVKYIIEFDRRGNNDCVFYDCGNEEFIKYIESFGFEKNYGSFSDISILGLNWDIAAVNLSSGYYDEHTADEYIVFHELVNNINRVVNILIDYNNAKYYDYQEKRYTMPINYDITKESEEFIKILKKDDKNS